MDLNQIEMFPPSTLAISLVQSNFDIVFFMIYYYILLSLNWFEINLENVAIQT